MQRCDWCQELGNLVAVVNHDKTASHTVDWVCPACAEIERYEHADEILWNPLGFTPSYQKPVAMTDLVDDSYAVPLRCLKHGSSAA
jgi:hypothetical protein